MNLDLLDPGPDVVETRSVSNVVHQNNTMSIAIICLGDVSVSFLASCIPLFQNRKLLFPGQLFRRNNSATYHLDFDSFPIDHH